MRAGMNYALRGIAVFYLAVILVAVVAYKAAFLEVVETDPFFQIYGLVVCTYIVSRFLFSLLYRSAPDAGLEPRVAVIMPAFNEEEAIAQSVLSLLSQEYPEEKLQVIVVDDGSTDGTLEAIMHVARANARVEVIAFNRNRGKRAAMAAGIRQARDAEVLAFVDSDSMLKSDALRMLVQGFADPRVGAMAGHAGVLNARVNWMTKMQAVRYFTAFKVCKAAESVFGAVTCCSGCFAAYRREAILPHLEAWEHQRFLGQESTFGDDRSLTNYVLRNWKVRYEVKALSLTLVPETFRQFMRQQVRWKRSWTRESLRVGAFIWRKHPCAALATYAGIILPLIAPIVAVRATLFVPLATGGGAPVVYLVGIYAMALVYGLYYAVRHTRYDALWVFGVVFVFFYLAFLLWQTYWAILTARSSDWGTRGGTPAGGSTAAVPAPVATERVVTP
jgi:hyaluronan synthase